MNANVELPLTQEPPATANAQNQALPDLTKPGPTVAPEKPIEVYSNADSFALAQRMAKSLSESTLVPEAYQRNIPNCLIVLEMAARIGCSPLMAAQNLHVIHGRPSWASTFIIASINSCGKFSPLRFKMEGNVDSMDRMCTATAIEKDTGDILEGPTVSMKMAQAEGWLAKNGSKWKTMPELMLRYRAAAFFGRLYAPEMLLGMHASDEVAEIINVTPVDPRPDTSEVDMAHVDQWVEDIRGLLASDSKDEYEVAQGIREAHAELNKFDALYTVVSDRLAREKIISKAQWRKALLHYPPTEERQTVL
jgi:hypothetical protein